MGVAICVYRDQSPAVLRGAGPSARVPALAIKMTRPKGLFFRCFGLRCAELLTQTISTIGD